VFLEIEHCIKGYGAFCISLTIFIYKLFNFKELSVYNN
jgi:hypothetical protein